MYFDNIKTIKEAKDLYRKLCKQLHPDMGGNAVKFEAMQKEFEDFINFSANRAFAESEKEYKKSYTSDDVAFLSKILKEIVQFDIDIEVIGTWIYCYNAYAYREQLKAKGFWFSSKHKAWVFSGEKKRSIRSRNTLADIRNKWGSTVIKNEKRAALTA